MAEYVPKEPILSYIDRIRNSGTGKVKSLDYVQKFVYHTSTIDIVTCRECRHYNNGDCTEMPKLVQPDDFCSYGERKDD